MIGFIESPNKKKKPASYKIILDNIKKSKNFCAAFCFCRLSLSVYLIMARQIFKRVSSSFTSISNKRRIAEIYELQDRVTICKGGGKQVTAKDRNLPGKKHADELPVK